MPASPAVSRTKPLGLVYDFNALAELQDKFGINLLNPESLKSLDLTPRLVRQLVWAGLIYKTPDISIEEAGAKVTLPSLANVVEEFQAALAKCFGASVKPEVPE